MQPTLFEFPLAAHVDKHVIMVTCAHLSHYILINYWGNFKV
jgi:hypothetical protein